MVHFASPVKRVVLSKYYGNIYVTYQFFECKKRPPILWCLYIYKLHIQLFPKRCHNVCKQHMILMLDPIVDIFKISISLLIPDQVEDCPWIHLQTLKPLEVVAL